MGYGAWALSKNKPDGEDGGKIMESPKEKKCESKCCAEPGWSIAMSRKKKKNVRMEEEEEGKVIGAVDMEEYENGR